MKYYILTALFISLSAIAQGDTWKSLNISKRNPFDNKCIHYEQVKTDFDKHINIGNYKTPKTYKPENVKFDIDKSEPFDGGNAGSSSPMCKSWQPREGNEWDWFWSRWHWGHSWWDSHWYWVNDGKGDFYGGPNGESGETTLPLNNEVLVLGLLLLIYLNKKL